MYYMLAGFLTTGADLLRRTLTGDSEYQAAKKHSKTKHSKMALSRSERKVILAYIQFGFPFCYTHTHTHILYPVEYPAHLFLLKKMVASYYLGVW
jgi:hypothetical protein